MCDVAEREENHLNKNLICVRIMVVMIIVGGVTISLVGCLNAPSIDKLFNALHKHLIFYVVCDRCVVCDSRGLRYFSFLTLLQSFEVRLNARPSGNRLRQCCGHLLRRFLSPYRACFFGPIYPLYGSILISLGSFSLLCVV